MGPDSRDGGRKLPLLELDGRQPILNTGSPSILITLLGVATLQKRKLRLKVIHLGPRITTL